MIWGCQVGLEDKSPNQYRQPEGKGTRFTVSQFQQLWLRSTGWEASMVDFGAALVPYNDLRVAREDKSWSMQWSIRNRKDQEEERIVEVG